MLPLRIVLVAFLVVLTVYTAVVISNHGWNLLAVFFGDMRAVNWAGQFNLDFMGFLLLSAFWTAWRHSLFSARARAGRCRVLRRHAVSDDIPADCQLSDAGRRQRASSGRPKSRRR